MFVILFISRVELRTRLGEAKEAIRNQVKKKTQIPTMKWVFFLFRRITELVIEIDGRKLMKVLNLDEETIKNTGIDGWRTRKILFVKKMVRNVGFISSHINSHL